MGARGSSSHGGGGPVINGVIGRDPNLHGFRDPDPSYQGAHDAYDYHANNVFDRNIWDNVLSADERRGIRDYTSYWYDLMNPHLRQGYAADQSVLDRINWATAGLSKLRMPENVVVYRGAGADEGTAGLLGGTVAQLSDATFLRSKIGKRVTDKGFMSSGVHQRDAWSGIRYKIYVNKGISGTYVDPVSANRGEHEFLFNRDTSFKVHGFKTNSNGKVTEIYLEAVKSKH